VSWQNSAPIHGHPLALLFLNFEVRACEDMSSCILLAPGGTKMSSSGHRLCIVIIDDNPRSLEYLSSALAQEGVEIVTASNPRQGLDLVDLLHPKIVLTDVVMPGMSGWEVLDRIKKAEPATDVLLMSACACGGTEAEVGSKGAAGFLKKPIPLVLLRERLKHLIEGHRADCAIGV
jgi:CheY-like chemotaxis protein